MSELSIAAVFSNPGSPMEIRQIPVPDPSNDEVLVRVEACTLCGSDLHSYEGRRKVPTPTILGHEIIGRIVALGDTHAGVDLSGAKLQVGDRVTWAIVASCDQCFYCSRGLPQKCLNAVKYGHEAFRQGYELLGGLAEFCLLVSGTKIVKISESLSPSAICPASCATATSAAALESVDGFKGLHCCVFGMGLLGLTATAMLKSAGVASITCVDVQEDRLKRANQFGATRTALPDDLDTDTRDSTGEGFDLVIEMSGASAAVESAISSARMGGEVVLVGSVFPSPSFETSPERIVRRNLVVRGIHNYSPRSLVKAVRFIEEHGNEYPFGDLAQQWYPLARIAEAIDDACSGQHIRVGVQQA